jgi:hypothetical protein
MEAGAVGFIQKPISIRSVEAVLEKYLSTQPRVSEIGEPLQCHACLTTNRSLPAGFCLPGACEIVFTARDVISSDMHAPS